MADSTAMWTVQQLLEATQGQLVRGRCDVPVSGICIDSRRLERGQAFVAIRGKQFDGHEFIEEAAHRGASCLVLSHLPVPKNGSASVPTIVVGDTTEALGDLARFHRQRLNPMIIVVTGSCGKTTTKDLIAHLLGGPEEVLKSTGSQNNHIGVPLTLLKLTPEHRTAVVELGTNHPGEIAYLASIAEPDAAVITNVGPAHLEFFGSLVEVLEEKLSVLEVLAPDGTAVLPGDQLDVCLEAPRHLQAQVRTVTFGTSDRCDLQALDLLRATDGMSFRLRDRMGRWETAMVGYHNVENALAALACAWAVGVPLSVTRERLATFQAVPLRSQVLRWRGLTVLNDCYNANPLSFARALETLRDMRAARKVAIVGDMLELGTYAPSAHQAIGRLANQLGIDAILAVGTYAECVAQGVREGRADGVKTYHTVPELLNDLPGFLQYGDGLLIKGSRKLNLEQVTEFLQTRYQRAHGELGR